jgi:predicted N-acetyltransferase YhbS
MEARLVNALRDAGLITLSLVAEMDDGSIAGNAVFSAMTFEGDDVGLAGVGLGPLAVRPEYQRQGVGSALVRRGIELCREAGFDLLVLLGSTVYYPRFGFVLAETLNLHPADEGVPPSHFQALMLRGSPPTRPLRLRYAPQFFME